MRAGRESGKALPSTQRTTRSRSRRSRLRTRVSFSSRRDRTSCLDTALPECTSNGWMTRRRFRRAARTSRRSSASRLAAPLRHPVKVPSWTSSTRLRRPHGAGLPGLCRGRLLHQRRRGVLGGPRRRPGWAAPGVSHLRRHRRGRLLLEAALSRAPGPRVRQVTCDSRRQRTRDAVLAVVGRRAGGLAQPRARPAIADSSERVLNDPVTGSHLVRVSPTTTLGRGHRRDRWSGQFAA